MPTLPYNLTNITGSYSFLEIARTINNNSESLFALVFIITIAIISLLTFSRYSDIKTSLNSTALLIFIVSSIFVILGLLNEKAVIISLLLLGGLLFIGYVWGD